MTLKLQIIRRPLFTLGLLGLAVGVVAMTSACTILREEGATRLATPVHMNKRQIETGSTSLVAYERVHKQGGIANVYIEGDGLVLKGEHQATPTLDPTPDNPVALHLATRDKSNNVIYLARPCQYLTADKNPACDEKGWAAKRFSVENMDAMNVALDNMRNKYGFVGFNLIGYGGGGQVAILLGAKRKDILTIRTVASTLDHQSWTANKEIPALEGSLNAKDFARDVATIPQHHFIGAWDDLITTYNYNDFRAAMGPSTCIRMSKIDETDGADGWVNRWPSIMDLPVDCNSDQ